MADHEPTRRPLGAVARDVALALAAGLWLIAFLPNIYLLLYAETWQGRVFAVASFLFVTAPFVLAGAHKLRRHRKVCAGMLLATPGLPVLLTVLLYAAAPDGVPRPGARVRSVYLNGSYARASLANLLPEMDQIKLGIMLTPYYDARTTDRQRAALIPAAMGIYREMRDDPAYESLGSAMNYSYAELYGGAYDVGHAYTIVPEHAEGERLPLLVFLHGSGGPFKAYLRVLEGLAVERRCVVVCPSFGFGNWGKGGAEAVERARAWAAANLPVDANRVTLMGLSNGGIGVLRTLARDPKPYARVILVSAVADGSALKDLSERGALRGLPILIVTGREDNRVPLSYVMDYAAALRAGGAALETNVFEDQDHFLVFQKRAEFQRAISAWLSRAPATEK
ncbi:MAG: prolyl oligopeptidase family serine peptidase [Planctomycetota bacterium]|nr:prolyl oligopeptidase family serine peptidase [Planctomycetota bacterium]